MARRRILLVEGPDDEHVLKHLCGKRGGPTLDEIKPYGGVEQLLESLPLRLIESDVRAVGVVVDADTGFSGRWQSLRSILVRAGYQDVPADPMADGTVVDPPKGTPLPRVGVWIMPDNQSSGVLEDFLAFLVPKNSPLFEHARASVANIPDGERRFSPIAEPKAVIHTWLAWQEEPGRPYGTAITAHYLDPRVPQVDVLVSWLRRLYEP